jgi:hypothetical protein
VEHFPVSDKKILALEQLTETIASNVNTGLFELGANRDKYFFRSRTRVYLTLLAYKGKY